jgi:hypothetical protein
MEIGPVQIIITQLFHVKISVVFLNFDAHGAFCYARSCTFFGCPYFVMSILFVLIKVNPRLIASDDTCCIYGTVSTSVWRFLPEQVLL